MAATAWMPTVGRGTGRTLPCGAQDALRSLVALEARPPGRKVAVPPGPGSRPEGEGRRARAEWRHCELSPSSSPGRRREGAVGAVTRPGWAGPGGALRHPSERPAERSRRRGHSGCGTTAAAGSSRCVGGRQHSLETTFPQRARGTGHCRAGWGELLPGSGWRLSSPHTCPLGFTALNHSEAQALYRDCYGDAGFSFV